MSRISPAVRGTPGIAGWGTMIRPARCSAVDPGRSAIAAKVGTSAVIALGTWRSTTWQFVHRRAASSCPRRGSAAPGCAKAESANATKLQVPNAIAAHTLAIITLTASRCSASRLTVDVAEPYHVRTVSYQPPAHHREVLRRAELEAEDQASLSNVVFQLLSLLGAEPPM
jgi:hypothetical protein